MKDFFTRRLDSPWRWVAMAALWANAAIHVDLAPMHLEEATYIGVLFLLLSAAAIVLAVGLALNDSPAVWAAAGVLSLAGLTAFVASRTVGLPLIADDIGSWSEPMEQATLLVETLTIAFAVDALQHWHRITHPVATEKSGTSPTPGKNPLPSGH